MTHGLNDIVQFPLFALKNHGSRSIATRYMVRILCPMTPARNWEVCSETIKSMCYVNPCSHNDHPKLDAEY
jgi:hypothetical protein